MAASLPTVDDLNVHNSLDERAAVEHFLGKDLQQAEALFRENFLFYQEDLMWMGPRAFSFYVEAAITYLLSSAANRDAEAVASFCSVAEFRLERDTESVTLYRSRLRQAVAAVMHDFNRFVVDPQAYRDLSGRLRGLLDRLSAPS